MKPRLAFERACPIVLAWVGPYCFFAACRIGWSPQLNGATDLLSGTASLGAVLIGFVFAAKSILLTMDTQAAEYLGRAKKLGRFFVYLFDDVLVWLLTTVTALVLLTAQPATPTAGFMRLVGWWTWFPCWGLAMSCRSMLILSRILRDPKAS